MPFAVGAVAVVAAVLVLSTGHRMLAAADAGLDEDGPRRGPDDVAGEVADEFGGAAGRDRQRARSVGGAARS